MDSIDFNEPAAEYRTRLVERQQTFEHLDKRHVRFGNIKCAMLLACAAMLVLAATGQLSYYWVVLPAAAFIVLCVLHEGVIARRALALRAVGIYRDGLDRLLGRWAGRGSSGSRFRSYEHPYSEDLDLFGPGSLFDLMCAARTRAGEERLASWLTAPGEVAKLRERHEAVTELKARLDLREDIAVLGAQAAEAIHLERLGRWCREQVGTTSSSIRYMFLAITLASVAAALAAGVGASRMPVELLIFGGQALAFVRRKSDAAAARGIDKAARDLALLKELLIRLERESFQSPMLKELALKLHGAGELPSRRIARLLTTVTWRDSMRSNMLAIAGIALLWNTHSAFALERWRSESGQLVHIWIETVAQFEALSSLARFAFERPNAVLPVLVDSEPVFDAVNMLHPLLKRAVPNSVTIGPAARLLIVSGSNMSGKSTLLRTIGINSVLALAGAPVCADSMRVGPLHIGASLRTVDSLQAGVSRFYAEIKRLRQIVDIARESPPALFLLDEVLHGTNSHDRRVGAEAVVRVLLAAGAIGLITTHDLALAAIAEDAKLGAINVHFQDELVEGKMEFDYQLQPGIVQKSNAIPLMRAVGLDV